MAKYAKLFGYAQQLHISIDELRLIAAEVTGKESLRSLSDGQLRRMENKLKYRIRYNYKTKRDQVRRDFERSETLTSEQFGYLTDLITAVFGNIQQFRSWLGHYFLLSHERYLNSIQARKIIKALENMRKRNFKTA